MGVSCPDVVVKGLGSPGRVGGLMAPRPWLGTVTAEGGAEGVLEAPWRTGLRVEAENGITFPLDVMEAELTAPGPEGPRVTLPHAQRSSITPSHL